MAELLCNPITITDSSTRAYDDIAKRIVDDNTIQAIKNKIDRMEARIHQTTLQHFPTRKKKEFQIQSGNSNAFTPDSEIKKEETVVLPSSPSTVPKHSTSPRVDIEDELEKLENLKSQYESLRLHLFDVLDLNLDTPPSSITIMTTHKMLFESALKLLN